MKCINCNCCHKDFFHYAPDAYVCTGVKEPFIIRDVNAECTEYPEKRNTTTVEDAIAHFKYGITHDIFKEPVTSYAKLAVKALEMQATEQEFNEGYEEGYVYGYYKGIEEFAKYLKDKAVFYEVADHDWGWFSFKGINIVHLDYFIDDFSNKTFEIKKPFWLE